MVRNQLKIDVIQDGQPVDEQIIKKYNLQKRDIFYSVDEKSKSNFVGLVRRGTEILVSLPKHFMSINEFKRKEFSKQKQYIHLIMDSINSTVKTKQNTKYNSQLDLSSDFALDAYFKVYQYYLRYGLYHQDHQEIKPRTGKKISWKDTLRKSSKYISKGNIIFSPLYYKRSRRDSTLVTECMTFVLNYTQYMLGDFMSLPNTSQLISKGIDYRILNNESIIRKLQEILSLTYKDINKQLIQSIIVFLKGANDKKQDFIDIKHYNFAETWERAVEKYLNDHFIGIDPNNQPVFSKDRMNKRFKKDKIHYNKVPQYAHWRLEPDHVFKDNQSSILYIFDSKYFTKLNDLNHKQFVYHVLYSNAWPSYEIYDSLILPTAGKNITKKYVDIEDKYLADKSRSIVIYATYLNMIEVLKNYII